MNTFIDLLARLLRGAIKIALVLAATVFVMGFLIVALVLVVLASLLSLLTGRKPAPVVMFSRMRANSRRYTQGVWPGRPGQPAGDVVDVVDVEVTEVPDTTAPTSGTRHDRQPQSLR